MPETLADILEATIKSIQDGYDPRRAWWPVDKQLQKDEEFSAIIESGFGRRERAHFAMWLVDRSLEIGVEAALAEFRAFIQSPSESKIPVIVLDQLYFESSDEIETHQFENGITLTAVSELSDFRVDLDNAIGLEVVLFPGTNPEVIPADLRERAQDVMRCLSAARGLDEAVFPAFQTEMWRRSVPRSYDRRRWGFTGRRGNLSPSIIGHDLRIADRYLATLLRLNTAELAHARLVLDRWRAANSDASATDTAVEVRICMEALLVTSSGENTYKTSRRGALMLGGETPERLENLSALKSAYAAGSLVIHGGAIKDKHWSDIQAVMPKLRKCIEIWLNAGAPKLDENRWQSIEMGEEFPGTAAYGPADS